MAEYDEEALRADANEHWQSWSLKLAEWRKQLEDLSYTRPDFSLAPGSDQLYEKFGLASKAVQDYLSTGEEVFEGIARALLDTVTEYMEMEGYAQSEIDAVEKEMAGL